MHHRQYELYKDAFNISMELLEWLFALHLAEAEQNAWFYDQTVAHSPWKYPRHYKTEAGSFIFIFRKPQDTSDSDLLTAHYKKLHFDQ